MGEGARVWVGGKKLDLFARVACEGGNHRNDATNTDSATPLAHNWAGLVWCGSELLDCWIVATRWYDAPGHTSCLSGHTSYLGSFATDRTCSLLSL